MSGLRALVVSVAAGCVACSLATSLSGYSGGAAAVDASTDGDFGPEASVDAGSDAPWCQLNAPDAQFCDDFDTNNRVPRSASPFQPKPDERAVVESPGLSDPFSLVLSTPASASTTRNLYALQNAPAGNRRVSTVSFDFRVDALSSTGGIQLAQIVVYSGDETWEVGLELVAESRVQLYTFDALRKAYRNVFQTPPLVVSDWRRVRLSQTLDTVGAATVDFDVDGRRLLSALSVSATVASGSTQLWYGIVYAPAPNDGWTVRYDNLVFDAD
jgi:hypothetical protein